MVMPSSLLLDLSRVQQWPTTLLLALLPLLSVLFLAAARWRRSGRRRRLRLPPGPASLPVLGHVHLMVGALPHRSLSELARRHGAVMMLRLGAVPAVVVSSAEAAREVLRTHDADCCSRPATPGPRRMSYNHRDVAFAPYSEYWREMRKLFVIELLSMRQVQATWYAREAQDRQAHRRSNQRRWDTGVPGGSYLRFMDGFIGTVALGNIYGTERFAYKKHFHHIIDDAMSVMDSFSAEDYYPNVVGRLVDGLTGLVARREAVFKELDAFFDMIIDHHLDPSRTTPDHGPDIIDVLIGLMKKHQGTLDFTKDNIKGLLSNIFTGAVDTSSVIIVWAMSEMVRNRMTLKKAQDEVRAVVGNKERVQPDDMPKLKYLRMVVKETLRLHPPAPLLVPRETLQDTQICGYDVPAKTRIFVHVGAIGRDPTNWDDPDEFNPDRFEGKDVDFNGAHFEFLPFGSGRRACPGMAMGLATTEFTLANLLYCFNWELPEGVTAENMNMEEASGLTVRKKTPLMVVPTRNK
ncbi:hypothetical protein ACP70R_020779 [Stipagrostis hirtigluma subsp. patula]